MFVVSVVVDRRMTARQIPKNVGSPTGKLVYLYLRTNGTATLDDLQAALDVSQLTLLTVLRSLRDTGLVAREDGEYATTPAPA